MIHAALAVGDRVRLTDYAQREIVCREANRWRVGTVVGFERGALPTTAKVLWDGLKRPQGWHVAFLERAREPEA